MYVFVKSRCVIYNSSFINSKGSDMTLTAENAVDKAGSFGRYQLRLIFICSYALLFTGMSMMVMTFSTAEPPWRCMANSTSCTMNGTYKVGDTNYKHRCSIPRSDWEFAVDGDFHSIVTEWDLVCDTAVYVSLVNSLMFIVWIFGSMLGSVLSDKYGRKTVAIPFTVFVCLCSLISAFSTNYWMFAVFRSLLGIGMGGFSITVFVLALEYVGSKHRGPVGFGIWFAWVAALVFLALLAWLIPNWRTLSIVTSGPGILFFLFWWLTPESLRWMLVKGKTKKAFKTLKTVAKLNGRHFTDEDLKSLEATVEIKKLGDIRDLFASRAMTHRTLVSWYTWLVSGLVYFGIALSTPNIGGNMYLNFFLSAVCEAIGMVIGIVAFQKLGRKKTMVTSLFGAGISTITAALLSYYDDGSIGYLVGKVITAMMLGRFFIVIAFDGIYIYSAELFPTVVRNTGMGTATSAARIGSASASYIVFSQRVHPLMPFGIMAITAFIAGILCLTLPETHNKPLPDTVEQINAMKKKLLQPDSSEDNSLAQDKKIGHNDDNTQFATAL